MPVYVLIPVDIGLHQTTLKGCLYEAQLFLVHPGLHPRGYLMDGVKTINPLAIHLFYKVLNKLSDRESTAKCYLLEFKKRAALNQ